jgi:topoisomerase-4 subunit A
MTVSCSEYDKILLIYKDGRYKAIKVPEKVFVDHDIYWAGKVKGKTVFNLLYREGSKSLTYIKRFTTPKFILDKDYRLFPAHKKSWIQFLQTGKGVRARIDFIPTARSKVNSQRLEFDEFLIKGGAAIGKRLSTRTVRRISELTVKVSEQRNGTETEEKKIAPKEELSPVPKPEKVSIKKKSEKTETPAVKAKKSKSQLGLFDLKKKE